MPPLWPPELGPQEGYGKDLRDIILQNRAEMIRMGHARGWFEDDSGAARQPAFRAGALGWVNPDVGCVAHALIACARDAPTRRASRPSRLGLDANQERIADAAKRARSANRKRRDLKQARAEEERRLEKRAERLRNAWKEEERRWKRMTGG